MPTDYASARHFHWYVSVIPRLTRMAGFELGSGVVINTVLPEARRRVSAQCKGRKRCRSGSGRKLVVREIGCRELSAKLRPAYINFSLDVPALIRQNHAIIDNLELFAAEWGCRVGEQWNRKKLSPLFLVPQ